MSQPQPRRALELDELLDPTRLAAAWQVAHLDPEPAPLALTATRADAPDEGVGPDGDPNGDVTADAPSPPITAAPALTVPLAHRQLLDELEQTIRACPALGAPARHVLTVPLAQLADALAPLEAAAAEAALDALEDLLQSLLATAGWPTHEED